MPVEGRGLSSRQTQQAVRDGEIGQPNNSEACSEAADGVARKSEGGSRLSLLRPVRQDQPRRHSGACVCSVPLEQGRTGRGRPGFCGHRSVWGRAVAGRTGACEPPANWWTPLLSSEEEREGVEWARDVVNLPMTSSGRVPDFVPVVGR